MCSGALLGYLCIVIYGIDERVHPTASVFDFLCNARLWLWIMSYTLVCD